jgi:hypothetical protein
MAIKLTPVHAIHGGGGGVYRYTFLMSALHGKGWPAPGLGNLTPNKAPP